MHLSNDAIATFLDGQLRESQVNVIDAHLDECERCREVVSEVVRHRRGLTVAASAPTDVVSAGPPMPVAIGDVIDGRYRIDRLLGVGGMGCVYEASQLALNTKVAVKFMLPALAGDASSVGRFLREARAVARLRTRHVCRVFDLGTLASGTPFLVMELLTGETVEERLAREGRLEPEAIRDLVLQALDALEEAHALGVVHRDLKPSNLFLAKTPDETVTLKVLDFGIAKSVHPDIEQGLALTSARTVVGSPFYMAPEQLEGGAIDARVDLWALGCVMYQLVSGSVPFESGSIVELMFAIQKKPHVRLTGPLAAIIDRCLSKSAAGRYASAAELRQALVALTQPSVTRRSPRRHLVVTAVAATLGLGAASWIARTPSSSVEHPAPLQRIEPVETRPPLPPLELAAQAPTGSPPGPTPSSSPAKTPPVVTLRRRNEPPPAAATSGGANAPASLDDVLGERR